MAQLVIDVNDNVAADVRDTLVRRWLGPVSGTNQQKMTFLKGYIASILKSEYIEQKKVDAATTASNDAQTTASAADIS